MNGLGKIKRFEEKSVDKNICKDFISIGTPGPGTYEYKNDFKKGVSRLGKFNPPQKEKKVQGSLV